MKCLNSKSSSFAPRARPVLSATRLGGVLYPPPSLDSASLLLQMGARLHSLISCCLVSLPCTWIPDLPTGMATSYNKSSHTLYKTLIAHRTLHHFKAS